MAVTQLCKVTHLIRTEQHTKETSTNIQNGRPVDSASSKQSQSGKGLKSTGKKKSRHQTLTGTITKHTHKKNAHMSIGHSIVNLLSLQGIWIEKKTSDKSDGENILMLRR